MKYNTKRRIAKRNKIQAGIIIIYASICWGIITLASQTTLAEAYIEPSDIRNASVRAKTMIVEVKTIEDDIRRIADAKNFPYTEYLVKLAVCESALNPNANGDSGKSWGLYQLHLGYHPYITPEQATDIEWSTAWTMEQILAGRQHLWSCDKIVKGVSLEKIKAMRSVK